MVWSKASGGSPMVRRYTYMQAGVQTTLEATLTQTQSTQNLKLL